MQREGGLERGVERRGRAEWMVARSHTLTFSLALVRMKQGSLITTASRAERRDSMLRPISNDSGESDGCRTRSERPVTKGQQGPRTEKQSLGISRLARRPFRTFLAKVPCE